MYNTTILNLNKKSPELGSRKAPKIHVYVCLSVRGFFTKQNDKHTNPH